MELAFTLTSFFEFAADAAPFAVTNVYAPCTPERRPEFLAEIRTIARTCVLPWILVGDFNLARCPDEKNSPNFDAGAAAAFNLAIEDLSLQDLPLVDRRFTWSNCRADPTLVRLDRALINLEWSSCCSLFRHERCWAFSEDYRTLIRNVWARPQNRRGRVAQRLSRSLKWARCAPKKWARARKRPGEVVSNCRAVIELLDLTEEVRALSTPELLLRAFVKERISEEHKRLDFYWRQRYAYRLCKLGDGNASFFHAGASARLWKNQIQVLHSDGVAHINHGDKARLLSDFYTSVLGTTVPSSWGFDPRMYLERVPHLDELEKPYTLEELKVAVWSMRARATSSPGPDGFGPAFLKTFWDTVAHDLLDFLNDFYSGVADLDGVNRAFITLLPKCDVVLSAGGFQPISLQNCVMKIISRILTTRLQKFIELLVSFEQSGFIAGRCITDNFLYAADLVQSCSLRKTPTIALKLDFKKAFDSTYLGLRLSDAKLPASALDFLPIKIERRIPGWRTRFLDRGGPLTLTSVVLSAIPTHAMSVLPLSTALWPRWTAPVGPCSGKERVSALEVIVRLPGRTPVGSAQKGGLALWILASRIPASF
ncbi:uncharacterized protein [Aegilops tauschii subsp. strangulata]|uniref:uncharacterized protein n=1 Tax=Aegilops tauschii subsp. strangulata TaxID=200361 RepID=UPI003CC8901B